MECKGNKVLRHISLYHRIDLTRMECKDTRIEDSALTEYRIDLTRMECKAENKDI